MLFFIYLFYQCLLIEQLKIKKEICNDYITSVVSYTFYNLEPGVCIAHAENSYGYFSCCDSVQATSFFGSFVYTTYQMNIFIYIAYSTY